MIIALGFMAMASTAALAQQQPVAVSADSATAQTTTTIQPAKKDNTNTSAGLGFSKHDSSAPINVSSDNFLGDLGTKIGTYSGNVVIIQGDMRMRADRVKIVEVEDKPNKIYAYVNVVVDAPNGTATGDDGVYDLVAKTITLNGKVVLTKEKNVMRGTKLIMDLNTNLAHLTAAGMQGGRVQAVLVPNQDKNGAAKKPAAKPAPSGSK
ncbi:MAG TPA: lipopolysaccharide transport periplasmic protein LptA [Rhizomicrobium sp.]|jgi:lipopolysaccharide export system protein LptA